MTSDAHEPKRSSSWCKDMSFLVIARAFFLVAIVVVIIVSIFFFDEIKKDFMVCLNWINNLGLLYGSLALCALNVVGALLFLPCLPFTLGAGFLYGCVMGTLVISVASTLASVLSFLTARYLARRLVEKQLGNKGSRFRLIDNAINKDGFRIVFLIRSSPIHPYGVCNYLFGLTSVTLRDYTVASTIAMMPATIMEVYFGTAMKNVADLISGNVEDDLMHRIFFWAGLLLSVLSTVYVSYWLKKKLQTELDKYEQAERSDNEPLTVSVAGRVELAERERLVERDRERDRENPKRPDSRGEDRDSRDLSPHKTIYVQCRYDEKRADQAELQNLLNFKAH